MKLFDKFKNKQESIIQDKTKTNSKNENSNDGLILLDMNNYALADISKENLSNNSCCLSLSKLSRIGPITVSTVNNIKNIIEQKTKTTSNLYRITNLDKNDSLKAMRDGKTFWGAIKKSNGSSTMAKLKEVNPNNAMTFDPTVMMMSVALASIEAELG